MSCATSWNAGDVLRLGLMPGTPETKLDAFSCNSSSRAELKLLTKHQSKSRPECFFQRVFNFVS